MNPEGYGADAALATCDKFFESNAVTKLSPYAIEDTVLETYICVISEVIIIIMQFIGSLKCNKCTNH